MAVSSLIVIGLFLSEFEQQRHHEGDEQINEGSHEKRRGREVARDDALGVVQQLRQRDGGDQCGILDQRDGFVADGGKRDADHLRNDDAGHGLPGVQPQHMGNFILPLVNGEQSAAEDLCKIGRIVQRERKYRRREAAHAQILADAGDERQAKIEEKELRIEHLTELVLKRNKMLFGQKSEKAKFINDGQLAFEGIFNEAEAEADKSAAEPTIEKVTRKSNKTGQHRGRKEIRADLETKKIVYELSEDHRICEECGDTLVPYSEECITTRIAVIPEKVYKIEYYRKVYKCRNCDKSGIKSNIVKAENQTPACIIEKGLPDASLVADIMQRKYQLGEPLYRQEQYWKLRGIYLNRTSLANWVIAGAKWFEPVIRQLWAYAYLEPVLNADETPTRVLKKDGKPTKKKGQMWIVCTGASASKKIALYTYRDSRGKTVAEELLSGYTGVVQTDGLQSYGSGNYENAGCWAHARRKFVDSIPEGDTACPSAQIVALIDKAAEFEREAKKAGYTGEKILEMRQKKIMPLLDQVYEIIENLRPGKGTHLYTAVTIII